jgi:hypothetical protein
MMGIADSRSSRTTSLSFPIFATPCTSAAGIAFLSSDLPPAPTPAPPPPPTRRLCGEKIRGEGGRRDAEIGGKDEDANWNGATPPWINYGEWGRAGNALRLQIHTQHTLVLFSSSSSRRERCEASKYAFDVGIRTSKSHDWAIFWFWPKFFFR